MYWLSRILCDDERQIIRWKGIVSRFKSTLSKMIKDVNGRFDDYAISPMTKQVSLHWVYEFLFFVHMKMSYYQLNRDKLLEKLKYRYHNGDGKENAVKYYENNKEVLKQKARN